MPRHRRLGRRWSRDPRETALVRLIVVAAVLLGVGAVLLGVLSERAFGSASAIPVPSVPAGTPSVAAAPSMASPSTPTSTPTAVPPSILAPTAVPSGPGYSPPPGYDPDPGRFDVPGQVRKAFGDFLLWVAETGLRPVLELLGATVLATPDLTGIAHVRAMWTTSLVAANAVFVLLVIAAGFVVSARDTLQAQYGVREMLPRLVVGGVAANLSLVVCGKAIEAGNALTAAVAGQGVDGPAAARSLEQILRPAPPGAPQPGNFMVSVLLIAVMVMAVVAVAVFVLRVVVLVVLVGVAPLALLCHGLPQTEGLAFAWWRAFGACLAIQFGQAVVLVAALRVFLTPTGPFVAGVPSTVRGAFGVLTCLVMLWLLIKLPGWTRAAVLGPLAQRRGRGLVGQVVHAVVLVKTLGAVTGLTGPAARAAARGGAARRTGTPVSTGAPGRLRRTPGGAGRPTGRGTGQAEARRGPRGEAVARFSDAPAPQPPRPHRSGPPVPVAFSDATRSAPGRASTGPAPGVTFSHPPTTDRTRPGAPPDRPAPVRFSRPPTPPTPRAAATRAPSTATPGGTTPGRSASRTGQPAAPAAPVFSGRPRPAPPGPQRPPAPTAPVFSNPDPHPRPPAPAAPRARRPRPATPPTPTPTPTPTPHPSPTARPAAQPPPERGARRPARPVPPSTRRPRRGER